MKTFIVTRKADGTDVYRYQAEEPVEWAGMEFETHEHAELPPDPEPSEPSYRPEDWFISIGPFFDRFGAQKLPLLASTDPLVQAVVKDASIRKYIDLKGRRAELGAVLDMLRSKGFSVTDSQVLDAQPSAEEVYRG